MKEQEDHSNENDYTIILKLLKGFFKTKKFIISSITVFLIIGILVVIFTPKRYSSSVLFITQDSTGGKSSGLNGIASLLSGGALSSQGSSDLPTYLYPRIINSWEFRKQLFDIQLKLKGEDSLISFEEYALKKEPLTIGQILSRYTIGLPQLVSKKDNSIIGTGKRIDSLEYISNTNRKVLNSLNEKLSFAISKEDGTLEIRSVFKNEPIAAAQLAQQAQIRLQKEIIRYRIAKAKEKSKFIEREYKEKKEQYENAQARLASYVDRNRFNVTESSQLRRRQLENESSLLYIIYSDLEQQRVAQNLKIKEDTPNFTVINPAIVPISPMGSSKLLKIFIFGLLGLLFAIAAYAYSLGKEYISKLWGSV